MRSSCEARQPGRLNLNAGLANRLLKLLFRQGMDLPNGIPSSHFKAGQGPIGPDTRGRKDQRRSLYSVLPTPLLEQADGGRDGYVQGFDVFGLRDEYALIGKGEQGGSHALAFVADQPCSGGRQGGLV